MKYLSRSGEETKEFAQNFLNNLKKSEGATVITLSGDLGSGKTNFAQAVGEIVGVNENMHSPTFVIEKIYSINWKGFKKLIHIDAYRIEKDSELINLGWNQIIADAENLVLMEWPENVSKIIPDNSRNISFKFIDSLTREIEYEK